MIQEYIQTNLMNKSYIRYLISSRTRDELVVELKMYMVLRTKRGIFLGHEI
jgi:hypothetical protein